MTDKTRRNGKTHPGKVHRQLPGDVDVIVEQVIASVPLDPDGEFSALATALRCCGDHYAESGRNEAKYRFELPDNRTIQVDVATTVTNP